MTADQIEARHHDVAASLLDGAVTPDGKQFAVEYSLTGEALVGDLRAAERGPEPERTPGARHSDPVLAERGWRACEHGHGVYVRRGTGRGRRGPRGGLRCNASTGRGPLRQRSGRARRAGCGLPVRRVLGGESCRGGAAGTADPLRPVAALRRRRAGPRARGGAVGRGHRLEARGGTGRRPHRLDEQADVRRRWGRPPSRRIRPETERKILAVTAAEESLSPGALVDATGARRRLQALVALGYSQAVLAERLGQLRANFTGTMTRERLTAGTVRVVRALYDELWDKQPDESTHRTRISASRARNYAQARGWPVPLAWDEPEIDDQAAGPAEGWRRSERTTIPAEELVEDAEFVRQAGDHRSLNRGRCGSA